MNNKTLDIWYFSIMLISLCLEFFSLGLFVGTSNWNFLAGVFYFGLLSFFIILIFWGNNKIVLRS